MNKMNVVSDVTPSGLSSQRSTPDIYMARKIEFNSNAKNWPGEEHHPSQVNSRNDPELAAAAERGRRNNGAGSNFGS